MKIFASAILLLLGTLPGAFATEEESAPADQGSVLEEEVSEEQEGLLLDEDQAIPPGAVYVIPIQGMVTNSMFVFLRRSLKEAERTEAAAVILDMDTPGGSLSAAEDIVQALLRTPIPTYTFINPNAGSAGAIISLATDYIYMAPVSAVGAAAPVAGGGDLPDTMKAKTVSYYSGYFRSTAESKGHRPEIAEAFINENKEIIFDDVVITKEGELLTLSAQEAVRVFDDRPVFAVGLADSIPELMEHAGLEGPVIVMKPSGFETLAHWITVITPILLMVVFVGFYMEFQSPGFGLPGAAAITALLIMFSGHFLAGLTGYEVLVIFILGALLVIAELLFFPGMVFPAVAGALMMIGSLLWMMVDHYPSEPVVPNFDMLTLPLLNLAIALFASAVLIGVLIRYLPGLPLFRMLLLNESLPGGPSLAGTLPDDASLQPGRAGITRSPLYPNGKAMIDGQLVDVVAEGEFMDPDTPVEVASVEGSRVVVRRRG